MKLFRFNVIKIQNDLRLVGDIREPMTLSLIIKSILKIYKDHTILNTIP